jgi:hypothetical protein
VSVDIAQPSGHRVLLSLTRYDVMAEWDVITRVLEDGRRGEARLPVECEGPAVLTDEVLMAACAIYAFLRSGEEEPGADAGGRPN